MKRLPVMLSFFLFLALSASITYWLLQWLAPSTRPLIAPLPAERALPAVAEASNLFGGNAGAASTLAVQLSGLIMANRAADSVAIIALPTQPARALIVHAGVVKGLVVKEINPRSVVLTDSGVDREVRLPEFSARP